MGKKKKQPKPASKPSTNYQDAVMVRPGAICEKLDQLMGLVNQVLVKITPTWIPYTPTPYPNTPQEPIVVMYGVRPNEWNSDKYRTVITTTTYPPQMSGTDGTSTGTQKGGTNKC